jgi:hypothetical protein
MAAWCFFFRMEGGHLVNANRFVQTSIDIDQRVCNAIHGSSRGVHRHQMKKTSVVVCRRKIASEPKPLKQTTISVANRGEFSQPWANRHFTLTSNMHETKHSNDTLNKRVGWGSEATFSPECTPECRNDKYKIAKWWRPVSKDRELALYKWMHVNLESRAIETRKHRIARVHDIQAYLSRHHSDRGTNGTWEC